MAITFTKYNSFLKGQMNGTAVVDFDTDTFKVALLTSSYIPVQTTHKTWADISDEVTGSNYLPGGSTLTGITLTESNGVTTFDANDVTWLDSSTGFTNARYAVLYKSTGVANTSTLIALLDLSVDKSNVGGDYAIFWHPSGIISWS